jgi:hypothetical protein
MKNLELDVIDVNNGTCLTCGLPWGVLHFLYKAWCPKCRAWRIFIPMGKEDNDKDIYKTIIL